MPRKEREGGAVQISLRIKPENKLRLDLMAAHAGKDKGLILDEAIEALWTPERKQAVLDEIAELSGEIKEQKTEHSSSSSAGVVHQ